MPGPISDSYDPEWGTSDNGREIRDALNLMHRALGAIIGSEPKWILDVVRSPSGKRITATLSEREWRILRFACERAEETI